MSQNVLSMAIPMLDARGSVEGWYYFHDEYLSPEVRYTSFPPTTWVKLGGRFIEIDRAVPLKIRLLEEDEDYHFWCRRKQHSQRINCGEYHKDFGDVEVGYSFSTPQTHIWFSGYAIHADAFENIHITSHNATIRVTPEHIIPKRLEGDDLLHTISDKEAAKRLSAGNPPKLPFQDLSISKSLFEMVVEEGADFPVYTAAVPIRRFTNKGCVTELVPSAEFVNDCEREIIRRDQWDVGAAVAQISDPVSYPPTFPPVRPFENSSLFWSFIYNQLLAKRLSRDELEQAYKDIALLNRLQQYEVEAIKRDKEYGKALDRLAYHFSRKENLHKATWPTTDSQCKHCKCVLCRNHDTLRCHINKSKSSPHGPNRIHEKRVVDTETAGRQKHSRHHKHKSGDGRRRSSDTHRVYYSSTSSDFGPAEFPRKTTLRQFEKEEAAHKLANCWKPTANCSPEDIAASTSPSVLSVPLYFTAGGIRPLQPGIHISTHPQSAKNMDLNIAR